MKKLAPCASAHRVGSIEKTLEGGSLDVMGNLHFKLDSGITQVWAMEFNMRGSALKFLQSPQPYGPEGC